MTIFGTRPEIIRLSCVFANLDAHVTHVMVHTGQSFDYEMDKVFFEEMKIRKPDHFLEVKSATLGQQIAKIIERSETVMLREKPDAVLVLGDTNSALAAIVAKRMKIPVFHMEAGNRCFDERVPEEVNRKIVDHVSDINLPYSENARLYLLREGVHPGSIFVTGSPIAEVLSHYKKQIEKSSALKDLKLTKQKYFVASIHREENVDSESAFRTLIESLNAVAEHYKLPIVVSTHPRTAMRIKEYGMKASSLVQFYKPFGYFDYIQLQKNAFCVLSDSGTILEESALLGFPAIQPRVSSERPEAFDEGIAILSGLQADIILQAIEVVTSQKARGEVFHVPEHYQDTNVSSKVVRHIVGLTKIVAKKRTV